MNCRVLLLAASVFLAIGVAPALTQQRDGADMVERIMAVGLQRSRALVLYRTLTY